MKKKIKKGVGKLSAPMVMHLMSRNRFFTNAKYVVILLSASSRICHKCRNAFRLVCDFLNHMTRGHVPRAVSHSEAKDFCAPFGSAVRWLSAALLIFWLGAISLPLMADGTNAPPVLSAAGIEDFGQYLAEHQAELTPFFEKNAGDFFKMAVPMLMGLSGWIILVTMLVGWGVDILMSRGYAFFFAPAFADIKRSVIYATGRLFLSFVYTCLLGLAIVFSLKFSYAGIVMLFAVGILLFVALAAQIVWILYLYRTDFPVSVGFYAAIIVVHCIVGFFIARPVAGVRASSVVTDFVDRAVTPR